MFDVPAVQQFARLIAPDERPREGCFTLRAESFFAERSAVSGHLRAAAPRGMPFVVGGACLEPFCGAGDVLWVDLGADVRDGDLVVFQPGPNESAAYREAHGRPAPPLIAKFLTHFVGSWWYVANDSAAELEAETVIGPVVAISRPRIGANSEVINGNAATETFMGYSGTPDAGITATASATTIGNSTMTPGGPAVDCSIIVTVTRSASQSAGTIGTVYAVIGWDDSGGGTYVWSPNYVALTAAAQNLTLQYEFSHLAANAGHSKVTVAYANTSGVNATVSATPAHVQVEFIKR